MDRKPQNSVLFKASHHVMPPLVPPNSCRQSGSIGITEATDLRAADTPIGFPSISKRGVRHLLLRDGVENLARANTPDGDAGQR